MSGATGTCSECQGKFRPGHLGAGGVCGTCEALLELRLRLFVASGRCPGDIGGFIEEKVRECHRLLLEEAERWWTAQSLPGSDPSGLQRVVKAPSPAGPPTASGGSRERGLVKEGEKKRPKEEVPSPRQLEAERGRGKEERATSSHRRHHKKREHTTKRRESRSPSHRPREDPAKRSSASNRPKKHREEEIPDPPRADVKEELSEGSSSFEDVRVEQDRRPSQEAHRSSKERAPRTPSRSPQRKRWQGPIPAGGRRQPERHQPGRSRRGTKKRKKNKGKKKRENHQRWLRENRRYTRR